MLEEFPKKISHDSLLTTEQRMEMTNENHVKSRIPKKKKRQAKPELSEEEQARIAKKQRLAKSAENRKKAEKHAQSAEEQIAEAMQMTARENHPAKHDKPSDGLITVARRNPPAEHIQPAEVSAHMSVKGNRFKDVGKLGSRHRASTIRAIFLGVCAFMLVGVVIYGRMQTNEIYSEIAKAQTEYDDAVAKNVSMRSEMEGKMTVKNVAEYAENVLGLKQIGRSQIQYIQIQTEDEVTIPEPETNLFVRIHEHLTRVWEFIKGE